MSSLDAFIPESHQMPSAISALRSTFQASPVGLASIDSFLKPSLAEAIHSFLCEHALFADRYGSFAEGEIPESAWRALPDEQRMFHFQSMSAPKPGSEMLPATLSFLRVRHAIKAHAFDSFFSAITDAPIRSATTPHAHRYQRHHFLRTHTDNKHNRKLALIIYLSKDFDSSAGGCLALAKNGVVLDRVAPTFNKLVFFDVTKNEHYIEPFTGPAPTPARMSMGWWFET